MSKIKNTTHLWDALSNVIDKVEKGEISKEETTAIINASKVMVSIKNYELKHLTYKAKFDNKDDGKECV